MISDFSSAMSATNEATFTYNSITNCHTHTHSFYRNRLQYRFSIKVWAGVVKEQPISPL